MNKVTLLDGAVGTTLWGLAEARGFEKVPVWKYNIEHPELVAKMTADYAAAGSEIVSADTFGANRLSVKRSSSYSVEEIVTAAVTVGQDALKGTGASLALDIGPLSQLMEPYGELEEEEVEAIYDEMIAPAVKQGIGIVMFETFMDLEMMKVAARTAKRYGVKVFCTMTFEKVGKTLMGNSVDDIIEGLAPLGVDAVGMNCSLGPAQALPVIRSFAEKTDLPLMYKPNAGLPVTGADGNAVSGCDAEGFAREVAPALEFVTYAGGCCGTDPDYIRALKKLL